MGGILAGLDSHDQAGGVARVLASRGDTAARGPVTDAVEDADVKNRGVFCWVPINVRVLATNYPSRTLRLARRHIVACDNPSRCVYNALNSYSRLPRMGCKVAYPSSASGPLGYAIHHSLQDPVTDALRI